MKKSALLVNAAFAEMSLLKSQSSLGSVRQSSTSRSQKLRVLKILETLDNNIPDPRCELFYETPFQLLVSVVLSAQTTDKGVNRCMEPLHKKGLDAQMIKAMGIDLFREKIKTIGLANTKAKNVVALATKLLDDFPDLCKKGEIPEDRDYLESLPGVGRKTASVLLGEIFNHPTLAVDTHVFRVSQRLGLHSEPTPQKAELALLKIIPKSYLPRAHHWFILHGRSTCSARNPACSRCVLNSLCPSSIS